LPELEKNIFGKKFRFSLRRRQGSHSNDRIKIQHHKNKKDSSMHLAKLQAPELF